MVELISIHIPKTAGTAFRHVLLEVYGCDAVKEDYPPEKIYKPTEPIWSAIKVIHGHFHPRKYHGYFTNAKRIVWLRHPIFRLISEYFFAKKIEDRKNVIHAQLLEKNLGLLEFAEIPGMRNFLSKKIQPMKLTDFDFVGIQEFYAEDLQELKVLLGWGEFQVSVKNSNRHQDYQRSLVEIISDRQLMNKLASLNSQDMELYQKALNLRAERRQESPLLQTTLADWSRSEFVFAQMEQKMKQLRVELEQSRYWLEKQSPQVDVLEVVVVPLREVSNLLLGFNIELPRSPIKVNGNTIPLKGWAIGKYTAARDVAIVCEGKVLNQTPVNQSRPDVTKVYQVSGAKQSGFETFVVVTGMPLNTELVIQVILENNSRIKIGVIRSSLSAEF